VPVSAQPFLPLVRPYLPSFAFFPAGHVFSFYVTNPKIKIQKSKLQTKIYAFMKRVDLLIIFDFALSFCILIFEF